MLNTRPSWRVSSAVMGKPSHPVDGDALNAARNDARVKCAKACKLPLARPVAVLEGFWPHDKGRCNVRLIIVATVVTTILTTPLVAADNDAEKRLNEAAVVLSEVMATPDRGIPQDLIAKAHCIVIVPELKTAAFVVGGKYGKGFISCRKATGGGWSAPGAVRIEGGSVGFQIGGSSTDVIMLVMNERGADKLLSNKFTLGAEASVAAGPVGRTAAAQTDAQMRADILSWSRSQGLFAGVALQGATLRQDLDDNSTLYGKELQNREIVTTGVRAPKAAAKLLDLLNRYSARERTK